jgi:hypothetical protein
MFWILMLILLRKFFEMFSLIQIAKKYDLNWVRSYEIDLHALHALLQFVEIHLILISISDLNVITLKAWTKFSLNQDSEANRIY